jgi:hypothetical protein
MKKGGHGGEEEEWRDGLFGDPVDVAISAAPAGADCYAIVFRGRCPRLISISPPGWGEVEIVAQLLLRAGLV